MRWRRRSDDAARRLLSVVVPVYNVADYLPAALDSVLAQKGVALQVVVVDDGSTDSSGRIADEYAARYPRVRVVHTANAGLGAARNEGARHCIGELLTFCDSDDVVPPGAYERLVATLAKSGSDFATGSIVRWETGLDGAPLVEPPWMHRLHTPARHGLRAAEHPEILGDVFAWNKVFTRAFWDAAGLSWPTGVRYEDQPTTTRAYLAGRFDVVPDIVYHWRIRADGSSITQQRSSLTDLQDRFATKKMALSSVLAAGLAEGDTNTGEVFLDRVLAGDVHRYFTEIPGCCDEWWEVLADGVGELWGSRSLVHSGLPPVHRLTGWLVEKRRRDDAAAVMTALAGGPVPRRLDLEPPRLDLSALGLSSIGDGADAVPLTAYALRPHER